MASFKFSFERKQLQKALNLVSDLSQGNFAVEKDLKTYLKKYPNEADENYQRRKDLATFYNFFKAVLRQAAIRPFSSKITIEEDFPEQLKPFLQQFSSEGETLLKTSYDIFYQGLQNSGCGMLVDFYETSGKPYLRVIPLNDILGVWKAKDSDGNYYYERVQFLVKKIELEEKEGGTQTELLKEKVIELIHPNIVRTYNIKEKEVNPLETMSHNLKTPESKEYITDPPEEKVLDGFTKLPFYYFRTENSKQNRIYAFSRAAFLRYCKKKYKPL